MVKRSSLPSDATPLKHGVWIRPDGSRYERQGKFYVKVERPSGRNQKLTIRDAAYIKGQLAAGASLTWLAQKFGVTVQTINRISQGKIWVQVEAPTLELEGPPRNMRITPEVLEYYKERGT